MKNRREYELRAQGIVNDLPFAQVPPEFFTAGINVELDPAGMRRSGGLAPVFGAPLFAPEHIAYNKDANLFYWLYASSSGIGVTDGVNHFDVTPTPPPGSTYPVQWTSTFLNALIVLNNQVDPPWYWDGQVANAMQPLPDFPAGTTCNAMRAFKNNLVALGISGPGGEFISQLLWSNSADPGTIPSSWTPLPENDAGSNVLADTIGALLDGQQFRDTFMLFKEHSTYLMNYVGGLFVFGFRKLFATSGILAPNCAAEYLGNVAVLTDGDFILSDGVGARSLIDKKMRSWLFNQIDSQAYRQCFVVSFHAENQVWCCFPEVGESDCTLALVWDGKTDKFGVRELDPPTPFIAKGQVGAVGAVIDWDNDNEAWDQDVTSWNQSIFNPTQDSLVQADRVNSKLYGVNEGADYAGKIISSRLERERLDLEQPDRVKVVQWLRPRIEATPGTVFEIRVGASDDDSEPVIWSAPVTYTAGQVPQKVDTFASGRYISYSIECTVANSGWHLSGVDIGYVLGGYY